MTPLPPTTPSTTAQYDQLISILTASPPPILEIDILPSSFPPEILYSEDPPSLGIPKAALIPLFLLAHRRFFAYTSRAQTPTPIPTSPSTSSSSSWTQSHEEEPHNLALDASALLLLWDPSHQTAANFRRRHLSTYLSPTWPVPQSPNQTIEAELSFIETLLTSPLPKHTKSCTLWSYRLWLVTYPSYTRTRRCEFGEQQWEREVQIVAKAAERHPANYYAWNYLRDLFAAISAVGCQDVDRRGFRSALASRSVREVHSWCLLHPRDISGWSFLVFLLRAVDDSADSDGVGSEGADEEERKGASDTREEVKGIVEETRAFVRKFRWSGSSVDGFLKAVEEFSIQKGRKME